MPDVQLKSRESINASPCMRCGVAPVPRFDSRTNGWDCVHICGDRCSGALNQPSEEQAAKAWNELQEYFS